MEHDSRQSVKHFSEYHDLAVEVNKQDNFSPLRCGDALERLIRAIRVASGDTDIYQDDKYPHPQFWTTGRLNQRIAESQANCKQLLMDARHVFRGTENVNSHELIETLGVLTEYWCKADYMVRHGIKVNTTKSLDHDLVSELLANAFTPEYVDIMLKTAYGKNANSKLYFHLPNLIEDKKSFTCIFKIFREILTEKLVEPEVKPWEVEPNSLVEALDDNSKVKQLAVILAVSLSMQKNQSMEKALGKFVKEIFCCGKKAEPYFNYLRVSVSEQFDRINKSLASNLNENSVVPLGSVMPSVSSFEEERKHYHPLDDQKTWKECMQPVTDANAIARTITAQYSGYFAKVASMLGKHGEPVTNSVK